MKVQGGMLDTAGGVVGGVVDGLGARVGRVFEEVLARCTVATDPGVLVAEINVLNQVIAGLSAAQDVVIAQFAAKDSVVEEAAGVFVDVDLGVGHVAEFAGDDLAVVLGCSPGAAERRVRCAAKMVAHLPGLLAAVAAGDVTGYTALVVTDQMLFADPSTCAAAEAMVVPQVSGMTAGRARALTRRVLAELDPDLATRWARQARAERFVKTREGDLPGVTAWWASLPVEDSLRCWAAIDELAHRKKHDDPTLGIDQARADAFTDLILGNTTITTKFMVSLPVETLFATAPTPSPRDTSDPVEDLGADDPEDGREDAPEDDPADKDGAAHVVDPVGGPGADGRGDGDRPGDRVPPVPGGAAAKGDWWATGVMVRNIGVIPPWLIQAMLSTVGTEITRTLIDADTGTTLETSTTTYRPSAGIIRHVRSRDGTCRFPGCPVTAIRCDVDHVIPFPHGPTAVPNLICLCRHHHRMKHQTRWRLSLTPHGHATWTDPYGQTWATHPVDHRILTASHDLTELH